MSCPPSPITSTRLCADLPDLPLLVIFDHLPMLDLFNRIPLVCYRWATLKSAALKRRTRLYLLPSNCTLKTMTPEMVEPNGAPSDCDVFLDKVKRIPIELAISSKRYQARVALDTLPLPLTYHGWTTGTGGRLLHPQGAEWLWSKLPNITELTISLEEFEGIYYYTSKHNHNQCWQIIYEQAIRLVVGNTDWCSQLTTLRLSLWKEDEFPPNEYLVDDLIDAINQRMPLLSVLHLGYVPSNQTTVLLTGETLARLRLLMCKEDSNQKYFCNCTMKRTSQPHSHVHDWLWRSVHSAIALMLQDDELRPDLRLWPLKEHSTNELIRWTRLPMAVTGGIRSFSLGGDMAMSLHLIPTRFLGLRSLKLSGNDWRHATEHSVLANVLSRLAPLTSLVNLFLYSIFLVISVDDDSQQPIVSLPSLQSLTLGVDHIWSHTEIGRALDWPQTLLSLQRLSIIVLNLRLRRCYGCRHAYAPFGEPKCRSIGIEPLQACPQLTQIQFWDFHQNSSITRSTASERFKW